MLMVFKWHVGGSARSGDKTALFRQQRRIYHIFHDVIIKVRLDTIANLSFHISSIHIRFCDSDFFFLEVILALS